MKKLILILISVVCLSGCYNKINFADGDYMIVEKSTYMTHDIHRYEITTRWKNGQYKFANIAIFAPADTYTVGDTLYFTTK